MNTFRDERTELIILYDSLLDQQKKSHKPIAYTDSIKQTRRKILGLYTQALNARKSHEDTHTVLP